MKLNFPKQIYEIVKDLKYSVDNIGRSEDKVIIFEDKYVLKISKSKEILYREKQMNDYLYNKISSSKSICFIEENNKYYYLRTIINGKSLIDDKYISNPNLLIQLIVKAVNLLKSLDKYNCPIKSLDNQGSDFIHGDLCLPNIYVNDNNEISGFIDLGNAGIGDRWYDYSWLIWSFQYNLKTNKYTKDLLEKLNIEFDKEKYNQYIPKEYQNI
jgi:kanamycin kinase/aminoglycoside 3'-phosphotransferase-3